MFAVSALKLNNFGLRQIPADFGDVDLAALVQAHFAASAGVFELRMPVARGVCVLRMKTRVAQVTPSRP